MDKLLLGGGAFLIVGAPQFFLKNVNKALGKIDLKLENNPDSLCLDEPKLGIGEIKKLKNFFSQKKWQSGQKRLVLIVHGEGLSLPAQNALLKTLEELRKDNLVFIGVTNKRTLLPTILSRSQIINSSLLPRSVSKPPLNLEALRRLSPADRLATTPKIITSLELEQTIIYYQKKVSQNEKNWPWLKKSLQSCLYARQMLKSNLKAETVVDWLLLNL